jgi:hypothetical protein
MCFHPSGGESGQVREQLELTVNGTIADSVLELIKDRFDNVDAQATTGPATLVTIAGIDQAGTRALVNLLWDTGHEIGSMSSIAPDLRS